MSDDLVELKARCERLDLLYQVSNVIHSTLEPREAPALVRAVREAHGDDVAPARNPEGVPVIAGVVPLETVPQRLSDRA